MASEETAGVVSSVVVAAGSLVAAGGATPSSVAVGSALAALPAVLEAAWSIHRNWSAIRAARWWQKVDKGLGSDEVRANVDARILREQSTAPGEPPQTSRVIAESVRALTETLDEAVVPALAALTAEYLREDKAVDWFFRAACRTLQDLDGNSLKDLQLVAAETTRLEAPGADLQVSIGAPRHWELHQASDEHEDGIHPNTLGPYKLHDGNFLSGILKQHGLGSASTTNNDRLGALRCFLDIEVMRRLSRVIGKPEQSST